MVSIEHLETPAFLVDVLVEGTFVYRDGNKALAERTGLGRSMIRGQSPQDLLPEPFASAVATHYRNCAQTVQVLAFEEEFDNAGTRTHWRTTLIPIHEGDLGRVTALLGIVSDITDSKRAELELLRANARLSLALQAVQGAHWEYDVQNHRFDASPSLALLLGEAEPRPMTLHDWISRIPAADRTNASFHLLVDGSRQEQVTRFRVVTPAGEERWLKCRRLAVRDPSRTVQFIFGVTVDVTDEVRTELRLVHEARRDDLTRLLNRSGFLAHLDAMILDAEQTATPLTVLMLDLDDFKAINDTRGHAAGDAVLATVGRRIDDLLRPGDGAARLGGDEFAIAVGGRDTARAEQLVHRLRRKLEQPCHFRSEAVPVAVSIGAVAWASGKTASQTMEEADLRLYADKRRKADSGRRGSLRRSA